MLRIRYSVGRYHAQHVNLLEKVLRMCGARTFTELRFWQRARQWSKRIFQLMRREAFGEDRRLAEQINDASESVMANVAEGFGRGTQGEFITFPRYAIGSLNETQSHLCAACPASSSTSS